MYMHYKTFCSSTTVLKGMHCCIFITDTFSIYTADSNICSITESKFTVAFLQQQCYIKCTMLSCLFSDTKF